MADPPPFTGAGSQSKVIEVFPGQSINAAIAAATPGTDILVHGGEYREAVRFEKSGTGGAPIRLISVDGKGAAHIIAPTPISSFREHDIGVFGFRLTGGAGGQGMQFGGTQANDISTYSYNVVLQDNIIMRAGEDGIKLHQARKFWLLNNTIVSAGNDRNGNGDGGIDFVAVDDTTVVGNVIQQTYGHACLMMKGGSDRNFVSNNIFAGCERDGITVGGFTTAQYRASTDTWEARWNTVINNQVSAGPGKCPIYMTWAWDNIIKNNKLTSPSGCTINNTSGGERANLRNQMANNTANTTPGGATGCMPENEVPPPLPPEEPPMPPGDETIPPAPVPPAPIPPPLPSTPTPPPQGGLPPTTPVPAVIPGTTNNPITGCAVDTWHAIVNQAYLQTKREALINQRYIAKPDSVLAYSCFFDDIDRIAQDAGPIFSENTSWVNKQVNLRGKTVSLNKQLGPQSLDSALVLAVSEPYKNWLVKNFSHGFLGGQIAGPAAPTGANAANAPVPNQSQAPCGIMSSVWRAAKCMNAMDNPLFPSFEQLITNDPRVYPSQFSCNQTGITQEMINIAQHKATDADIRPLLDPITPRFDLTDPPTTCTPPIVTGIMVMTRISGDQRVAQSVSYLDGICMSPGCSYAHDLGNGAGTCVKR